MVRQTSLEAFEKIRKDGSLSRKRWEVYEALYECGPATSNELLRHLQTVKHVKFQNHSNITTRLGELRDMGVSFELDVVTDPITGHKAHRFQNTCEDTPQKLLRKESLKQQCLRLQRELVELKRGLCAKCRNLELL